jgi:hypothetical protein
MESKAWIVKYALHPFSLKSLIYIQKNENNLHEILINLKKVIYITHLNTHYTHNKKGAVKPLFKSYILV